MAFCCCFSETSQILKGLLSVCLQDLWFYDLLRRHDLDVTTHLMFIDNLLKSNVFLVQCVVKTIRKSGIWWSSIEKTCWRRVWRGLNAGRWHSWVGWDAEIVFCLKIPILKKLNLILPFFCILFIVWRSIWFIVAVFKVFVMIRFSSFWV